MHTYPAMFIIIAIHLAMINDLKLEDATIKPILQSIFLIGVYQITNTVWAYCPNKHSIPALLSEQTGKVSLLWFIIIVLIYSVRFCILNEN